MDLSPFAITLLLVSLPVVGVFAVAAWLADRGIERVRVVSRSGKTLAEVVFGRPRDGH